MEPSSIAEFYRGRSVFITGATGFIGKALVEKLLRSCPDIERIYLLIRPLNGKTAECRLQEFTNNQIFENIRNQQPDVMAKVVGIAGDFILPGFGMSPEDVELLIENVSVVFNSAATIKFNENLNTAMDMNVKGPLQLLEICRQMNRLEAFIHVSTTFNNLDKEELKEEVIHSIANPDQLLGVFDCLDKNVISRITKEIMGNCPNTYVYTKGLAEQMLEERRGDLPLVIVRPSIVTAAVSEPVPGWVDNWNGTTGAIAAIGTGFIRVVKAEENMVADIIPVDYVINLAIAVAWNMAIKRPNNVPVYSCSTGQHNPVTWRLLIMLITRFWLKFPPIRLFWYPNTSKLVNDKVFFIYKFLFHYFPAGLLDLFYLMTGKSMKWVRLYRKTHGTFAHLEFFSTNQWRFLSSNSIRLINEMSLHDRKTFCFDVRQIEWENYFESYVLGIRRYVLRENPRTVFRARVKLIRFYVGRMLLNGLILFGLFYYFKNYLSVVFFAGTLLVASKFTEFLSKGQSHQLETRLK